MPKVTYTAAQGLVQSAGSGVSLTVGSGGLTFDSSPVLAASTTTTATSLTASLPGLYILSAPSSPVVVKMPLASSVPGGVFIFRAGTAQTHSLTGSAEAPGTMVFCSAITHGSAATMTAVVGNSMIATSDGKNFIINGSSGSVSYSGT